MKTRKTVTQGPREYAMVGILGRKGMGKTGFTKMLVQKYKGDKRALDPSYNFPEFGEWPGANRKVLRDWVCKLTGQDEDGRILPGAQRFHGLLILDDCDKVFESHNPRDAWRNVFVSNRHLGLDVIWNAHRPQDIPKLLISESDELWIFALDEVYALEYLAKIGAFTDVIKEGSMPSKPGYALHYVKRDRSVNLVRVF